MKTYRIPFSLSGDGFIKAESKEEAQRLFEQLGEGEIGAKWGALIVYTDEIKPMDEPEPEGLSRLKASEMVRI